MHITIFVIFCSSFQQLHFFEDVGVSNFCSIRDGGGVNNNMCFSDGVVHKVGTGENTSFWKDVWLDGVLLCTRSGRPFDLFEE